MKITVNGKPQDIAPGTTVADLLDQLQLDILQVVVERNATIIARQRYASQSLEDGDTLEIVHFVGGG